MSASLTGTVLRRCRCGSSWRQTPGVHRSSLRKLAPHSYTRNNFLQQRRYATFQKPKRAENQDENRATRSSHRLARPAQKPRPLKASKHSAKEDTAVSEQTAPPGALAAALSGMSEDEYSAVTKAAEKKAAKQVRLGQKSGHQPITKGVQTMRLDVASAYQSYRAEKDMKTPGENKASKKDHSPTTTAGTSAVSHDATGKDDQLVGEAADVATGMEVIEQERADKRAGGPEDTRSEREVFEEAQLKIENNTASLYNTRIRKKMNRGEYDKALQAWERMRSKGIQPLLKSYLKIIDLLIMEGPQLNVKYARRLVREMAERGLKISDEQLQEYMEKVDKRVREARLADRKSKKHNYATTSSSPSSIM